MSKPFEKQDYFLNMQIIYLMANGKYVRAEHTMVAVTPSIPGPMTMRTEKHAHQILHSDAPVVKDKAVLDTLCCKCLWELPGRQDANAPGATSSWHSACLLAAAEWARPRSRTACRGTELNTHTNTNLRRKYWRTGAQCAHASKTLAT